MEIRNSTYANQIEKQIVELILNGRLVLTKRPAQEIYEASLKTREDGGIKIIIEKILQGENTEATYRVEFYDLKGIRLAKVHSISAGLWNMVNKQEKEKVEQKERELSEKIQRWLGMEDAVKNVNQDKCAQCGNSIEDNQTGLLCNKCSCHR